MKVTAAPVVSNRMNPEDRKILLMQATLRCLQRHGFQGTSVRRICAEAGVSIGLINHHYAGKEELVAETYLQLTRTILQRLRGAIEQAGADPRKQLTAFFQASFAEEILDPSLLEAWIAFWGAVRTTVAMSEAHDAAYAEYRLVLTECLEGLARQHQWTGFDAGLAAIALSAMLDGLWLESGLNPNTFTPAQGIRMCEAWADGLLCGGYRTYLSPQA